MWPIILIKVWKLKDFSRSQAVTYTVKLWYLAEMVYHCDGVSMAYWTAPSLTPFKVIHLLQAFLNMTFCTALQQFRIFQLTYSIMWSLEQLCSTSTTANVTHTQFIETCRYHNWSVVVVVVCFTCDVMSATWQLTRRQNEAGSGHHPAS